MPAMTCVMRQPARHPRPAAHRIRRAATTSVRQSDFQPCQVRLTARSDTAPLADTSPVFAGLRLRLLRVRERQCQESNTSLTPTSIAAGKYRAWTPSWASIVSTVAARRAVTVSSVTRSECSRPVTLAGFFAEPAFGSPPGTADGLPATVTTNAVLHGLGFVLAFVSVTLASLVFAGRAWAGPASLLHRRRAWLSSGGDPADAFHVVISALPGFGFAGQTHEPGWDTSRTARAWAELMQGLGYARFGAQGGDLGALVSPEVGHIAPEHVVDIHLNAASVGFIPWGEVDPEQLATFSGEEKARLARLQKFLTDGNAYFQMQATRPLPHRGRQARGDLDNVSRRRVSLARRGPSLDERGPRHRLIAPTAREFQWRVDLEEGMVVPVPSSNTPACQFALAWIRGVARWPTVPERRVPTACSDAQCLPSWHSGAT